VAASLTLQNETSADASGSDNITLPTCQAGDLLVVVQKLRSTTSSEANTYPRTISGYETKMNDATGTPRFCVAWKIATASDSGATITLRTSASGTNNSYAAYAYRADKPIEVLSEWGTRTVQTASIDWEAYIVATANPTAITLLGSYCPGAKASGFTVGVYSSTGAVSPRTWTATTAADAETTVATTFYVKRRFMTTCDSVSVDMDDEGAENTVGGIHLCVHVSAV
jgi:hypothetical protein